MITYELFVKDKQGTINAVERMRSKYDKFAEKKVREAILKQTYFARQAIDMATSTSDLMNIQPSSVSAYVREAYVAIYTSVGSAFAAETYKQVKPLASKAKEDDAMKDEWSRQMERYLDVYGAVRIAKVAETTEASTRKIINNQVKIGMVNGDGIDVIKRSIMKAVDGISASRARMIARTEVVGASNQGSLIGAQASGVALKKRWLTAHNKIPPRPSHKAADGQTVGMFDMFKVGEDELNAPGDPQGTAAEVINCRCTVIYVRA